jgi:hypothetical protein
MTAIKINAFGGEVPRLADHLLTDQQAQIAQNVKIGSGALKAWKKPLTVFSPVRTGVASFYRMVHPTGDVWLTWTEDVNAVPGAIANDTDYKVYYTGQATPRKTNYALATNTGTTTECPFDYLELGVPAPTVAPGLAVVGGVGGNVTRSYVQTFVTSWGEESKPGPAVTFTGKVDGSWNLTGLNTAPAGKYAITLSRVYRTLADSYGTVNFQLVVEQNVATTTYSDTLLDGALGDIIETVDYDTPPSDLTNLISLPNGVMCGISPSAKEVCFCEPYKPWAWPADYRYAVEYTPVSVAGSGNSVLLATQGTPYIFSGNHPSVMASVKLPSVEPCAAKRSCKDIGVGVVYATENGFMLSSPAGAAMASTDYFSRDEWQLLNPSSMQFCKYDEKLFIFYRKIDGTKGGYVLDKQKNQLSSISLAVDYAYVDPQNAKLYILQDGEIKQWDGDPYQILSYTWRSRRFVVPRPVNLGAGQVDADFAAVNDTTNTNAALQVYKAENATIFAANADLRGSFNSHMLNETGDANIGYTLDGSLLFDLAANVIDQFVSFRLYVNGSLKFVKTISSRQPFRLPSGYKSDDIAVEIAGSVEVDYVKLAETMKELQTV